MTEAVNALATKCPILAKPVPGRNSAPVLLTRSALTTDIPSVAPLRESIDDSLPRDTQLTSFSSFFGERSSGERIRSQDLKENSASQMPTVRMPSVRRWAPCRQRPARFQAQLSEASTVEWLTVANHGGGPPCPGLSNASTIMSL